MGDWPIVIGVLAAILSLPVALVLWRRSEKGTRARWIWGGMSAVVALLLGIGVADIASVLRRADVEWEQERTAAQARQCPIALTDYARQEVMDNSLVPSATRFISADVRAKGADGWYGGRNTCYAEGEMSELNSLGERLIYSVVFSRDARAPATGCPDVVISEQATGKPLPEVRTGKSGRSWPGGWRTLCVEVY